MTCLGEGELRAYLDGECALARGAAIQAHVQSCARCSVRLARLTRSASAAQRLQTSAPTVEANAPRAWASLRTRLEREQGSPYNGRVWKMQNQLKRQWRPVLVGVVLLALIVGTLSFAPGRALARQFLSIFRVRQIVAVPVQVDPQRLEEIGNTIGDQLFLAEPTIVADSPFQTVASLEEASQIAGFTVRMPSKLFRPEYSIVRVKGAFEYTVPVNREALTMLLALAEMDGALIPANLGDSQVSISGTGLVEIAQGRYNLIQAPSPEVRYPEGIAPAVIGEAALRVLGLPPRDAQRISTSLDWGNTLLLPVPMSLGDYREVTVAGSKGVLLIPREGEGGDGSALIWEKDGILYMLAGPGTTQLLDMAESMF